MITREHPYEREHPSVCMARVAGLALASYRRAVLRYRPLARAMRSAALSAALPVRLGATTTLRAYSGVAAARLGVYADVAAVRCRP